MRRGVFFCLVSIVPFLATGAILAQDAPGPRMAWAPIVLLLVIAIGFAVGNLVISLVVGPSRS